MTAIAQTALLVFLVLFGAVYIVGLDRVAHDWSHVHERGHDAAYELKGAFYGGELEDYAVYASLKRGTVMITAKVDSNNAIAVIFRALEIRNGKLTFLGRDAYLCTAMVQSPGYWRYIRRRDHYFMVWSNSPVATLLTDFINGLIP